ncbi:MAG: hypothetical protein WC477_03405 [Patescibacteria group bacterium]
MNWDEVRPLLIRSFASRLFETTGCAQPERAKLDWVVAEYFLYTHPKYAQFVSQPPRAYEANQETFESLYRDYLDCGFCDDFTPWLISAEAGGEMARSQIIRQAYRYQCIVKLARLLYEHLCSDETGQARMHLDWSTAERNIDNSGFACFEMTHYPRLMALYSYSRFELWYGKKLWDWIYIPLVKNELPSGYTSIRRGCDSTYEDHVYGCVHAA